MGSSGFIRGIERGDDSKGACRELSGAGGNRTPVRRAVAVRATTIPEVYGSTAAAPPGRWASLGGRRRGFARGQRSFPPPAVFPAVNHRFCCRAAMVRPRVPLRVAGALVTPGYQAARAYCLLAVVVVPRLRSLSNSGRTIRLPVPTSKPISPLSNSPTSLPPPKRGTAPATVAPKRRGHTVAGAAQRLDP